MDKNEKSKKEEEKKLEKEKEEKKKAQVKLRVFEEDDYFEEFEEGNTK